MTKKSDELTFTQRQHEILNEMVRKACLANPENTELHYLYGTLCLIWYNEIYEESEIDADTIVWN